MHRILSYQTAMRAHDERDIRAYISKRTCISVILSTAFLTLVCGFLLGRFVADRQYQIKHLQDSEYVLIRELQIIRKLLAETSSNVTINNTTNIHPQYNIKLWKELITCCQTDENDFNVPLELFIQNLISKQVQLLTNCFMNLDNYIRKTDSS